MHSINILFYLVHNSFYLISAEMAHSYKVALLAHMLCESNVLSIIEKKRPAYFSIGSLATFRLKYLMRLLKELHISSVLKTPCKQIITASPWRPINYA